MRLHSSGWCEQRQNDIITTTPTTTTAIGFSTYFRKSGTSNSTLQMLRVERLDVG